MSRFRKYPREGADRSSRDSPSLSDDGNADGLMDSMATSVWGDMMREAVDNEDT